MIRKFFKGLGTKGPTNPPPLPPLQSDEVFVFAGTFASEAAATDYALSLSPTATLSQDLAAPIGPDDVEILFGADRLAAATPMFQFLVRAPDPDSTNTYILLSDRGYRADALTSQAATYIGKASVI